jgi:hypothetical protein
VYPLATSTSGRTGSENPFLADDFLIGPDKAPVRIFWSRSISPSSGSTSDHQPETRD